MHIAVLGGSRFIGFHLARALADAGHAVTVFNRRRTPTPEPLPPTVHREYCDRNAAASLRQLLQAPFDAVFDFSGYTPLHVAPVLRARASIGHYVFCSTSSVYKRPVPLRCNEDAPLDRTPGTYGGDKALAEDAILAAGRASQWPVTILRPHAVFGPGDAAQPGAILARLSHHRPIVIGPRHRARMNLLYVHDLVGTCVRIIGATVTHGAIYNVAGNDVADLRTLVQRCSEAVGIPADCRAVIDWPYRNLHVGPDWPSRDLILDPARVRRDIGLTFTPLGAAIRETHSWLRTHPAAYQWGRGERLVRRDGTVPLWGQALLRVDDATARWWLRHAAAVRARAFTAGRWLGVNQRP